MLHILETEYQHYFEFFMTDVFLCFFYLITQLCQYRLMDIYLILWIIIQLCYLICCSNCSSFGHWELVQLSPVCLLTYPIIVIYFFISFLISDTVRGSSCISPVPVYYEAFLQGVLVPCN